MSLSMDPPNDLFTNLSPRMDRLLAVGEFAFTVKSKYGRTGSRGSSRWVTPAIMSPTLSRVSRRAWVQATITPAPPTTTLPGPVTRNSQRRQS